MTHFTKDEEIFRCAYQGVKNVRFSENSTCLCFLETPVLRFALLPYYRRTMKCGKCNKSITQCNCLLMRSYDNSTWLNLEAVAEHTEALTPVQPFAE